MSFIMIDQCMPPTSMGSSSQTTRIGNGGSGYGGAQMAGSAI